MPTNPTLVIGGVTQSQYGSKVVGSAANNTQTDTYTAYGYNNVIIEYGGNLNVSQGAAPIGLHFGLTVTPYTTIRLGNAVGVHDVILLSGVHDSVRQIAGTALINATVTVTETEVFGPGNERVSLVNPGGTNQISLYETNNIVTLVGAANIVTTGASSTIKVNGNSNSSIDTTYVGNSGASTIRFGHRHDGFFGYTQTARIAPGDIVIAGDENVFVTSASYSSGSNKITLGNGNNTVAIGGEGNCITVGSGANTITFTGNANRVTVNDKGSHGYDVLALGSGAGDVIKLGSAGGLITGDGTGATTITQTATAKAAVTIDLAGAGIIDLGNGNDTITTGPNATVHAGAGHDTIDLGSDSTVTVAGSASSKLSLTLANNDVAGLTGGHVAVTETTNDTVYSDGGAAGSTFTLTGQDDLIFFGSNASGLAFLSPGGGDLAGIRALDGTGAYRGQIQITNAGPNLIELEGLRGGIDGAALTSYGAVLDNLTKAGSEQTLRFQGGGALVFKGHPSLTADNFEFASIVGKVVPTA